MVQNQALIDLFVIDPFVFFAYFTPLTSLNTTYALQQVLKYVSRYAQKSILYILKINSSSEGHELMSSNHLKINIRHVRVVILSQMQRKEKRAKLEIYFDLLDTIRNEAMNGEVKPTRLQYGSNMSYDKLTRCLDDLKTKNMINDRPLSVTEKGKQFIEDYRNIKDTIKKLGLEYLS